MTKAPFQDAVIIETIPGDGHRQGFVVMDSMLDDSGEEQLATTIFEFLEPANLYKICASTVCLDLKVRSV